MQAKNDPNWTEDAAFWNEAWADMDKRLDQEPPSDRRAAAPWWRQYSWLLGLLLAGMIAIPTAIAYWPPAENTEQLTPAPADVAPPPVIAAKTEVPAPAVPPQLPATPGPETDRKTAFRADQPSGNQTAAAGTFTPTGTGSPEQTTPELRGVTGSGNDEVPTTDSPDVSPLPSIDRAEKPAANVFAEPGVVKISPPAPFLPVLPVLPLKYAGNHLDGPPDLSITQPRASSALYLTAGATQGLRGSSTGFYAGLQYHIPAGKRFSIPIDLRFRKDFHRFKALSASDQPSSFLDVSDVTSSGSPDTIFFVFSDANITSVATTSLEVSTGLTYAPAPRWQVGVGFSLNYLSSARARVSSQFLESANFAVEAAAGLATDISLFNNAQFLFPEASRDNQNAQAISVSSLPEFNQWICYGNLSVTYALTPKASLVLSGRRLLTQPDRSRKIGMQEGQLEIGAKWRIW